MKSLNGLFNSRNYCDSNVEYCLLSTRLYYTMCAIGFTVSFVLCRGTWKVYWCSVAFKGRRYDSDFHDGFVLTVPRRSLPLVMFGMISTLGPATPLEVGSPITSHGTGCSWYSGHYHCHSHLLRPKYRPYSLIKSMDWFSLVGMAMLGLNISSMKVRAMTGLQTSYRFYGLPDRRHDFLLSNQPKPLLDLSVFKNKNFTSSQRLWLVWPCMAWVTWFSWASPWNEQ